MTTSLHKTLSLQLMRLVLRAGSGLPAHSVPGAITIHCLEGEAVVTTSGRSCDLRAGQLVMLNGGEPLEVKATTDVSLLVTVLLHRIARDSWRVPWWSGPVPGAATCGGIDRLQAVV